MRVILAQLLLAAGTLRVAQQQSPVDKVVELLTELQSKINADGESEQKTYDKFACWCEKTTKRKAGSIDAGKTTIGKTTTLILTLKGGIAVLASEIAEAQADIAKNNEAMKKFTTIREKENSDYQQDKAYQETAISSLHQAIQVLSGAGTGGDLGLLKVAAKVRSAVLDSPHITALTAEKSQLFKSFLEDPVDYYDKKAQAKASYSPQSATVTGILKDMYDTFAADLERSNSEESSAQMNFEAAMKEMEEKNTVLQARVTEKSAQKAEKQQQLAENEQLLESTQTQLKEDGEFFATAAASCKSKSDDWAERGRLRTEQLTGISEALEILTSEDAKATFKDATETRPQDTFGSEGVSFLQTEEQPKARAYRALKRAIAKTGSVRMAGIAMAVKTAAQGHFDDVIESIDTMISNLKDEGAEDIKQRDWCIAERNLENNKQENLEYDIAQLEAKIEKSEVKKTGLEADVVRVEADKEQLLDDMAQALTDRQDENNNFHSAKSDDEKAVALLEDAIAALSKYSANNAFLQQPEMEVSKDQAPDAEFSASDNHSGASKGIVSLLTQLKENLENEVALGTQSEAKATEQYDALKASADLQVEAYDKQLSDLAASIAATDATIEADGLSKTDTEGEHTATVAYLESIKEQCDWIEGAFTKRADARTKEAEGLAQAKSILAGSAGGDFGFLQKANVF